jgi:hypothetical protein
MTGRRSIRRVQRTRPACDADVLVIGSGAGGATTAALLAEAGLDVLVVEEGPWVEQGAVVPFSLDQMDQPVPRRRRHRRPRPAVDRVHRGPLRRRRHRGQQRALLPPAGSTWSSAGATRLRDRLDSTSTSSHASPTRSSSADHVTTVPGKPTPASEILRRGAAALGWRTTRSRAGCATPPGGDAVTGSARA